MNCKKQVLLSTGILGLSMLVIPNNYAINPVFPITQQEQLQQDRMAQWERDRRLEANQERPFENIAVPTGAVTK